MGSSRSSAGVAAAVLTAALVAASLGIPSIATRAHAAEVSAISTDFDRAAHAANVAHNPVEARAILEQIVVRSRVVLDPRAEARANYELGVLAEQQFDPASAHAHYRRVLELDRQTHGETGHGSAALARTTALEPFKQAFGELGELNRTRFDPILANSRQAIAALEVRLPAFTSVPVRELATLFVARSWLRLREPARAAFLAKRLVHTTASVETRALAYYALDEALTVVGDLDGAYREIGVASNSPAELRERIIGDMRRRWGTTLAATVAVVGEAFLLLAAVVSVLRRRIAVVASALTNPVALLFLFILVFGGYALAEVRSQGEGRRFLLFGSALLVVHVFAACWRGAVGDRGRSIRAFGGTIAALCVLAAAWMVMYTHHVKM